MICVHLQKLVQYCQQEHVRLGAADLVHLVCQQCGVQEVCPSVLMDEYDAHERKLAAGSPADPVKLTSPSSTASNSG